MKLLLALSVVLVTLFVVTEASSAESSSPTVMERFESFGDSLKEAATKISEKAKSVYKDLHDSEFGTKTRNWFSDTYQKVKGKISGSD
ncbi:apolipoprotein C-I [Rhinophrynus dorsalis]